MAAAARSATAMSADGDEIPALSGARLWITGIILALVNFVVVLDTTIANVSVSHIAGGLAVSPSSGTWVITSYAVSEAICVPLTGWLSNRFGAVRTFMVSLLGFGLFSGLCGLSTSLEMLVLFRLGQGFCGGPLLPLTQTLLIRVFPKDKQPKAMALWAMTVVTAPILGPIIGGLISDNWSWHWIFFINLPIIGAVFFGLFRMLRQFETSLQKLPIDGIGLGLLVIWVGSLQLMLDKGREEDWFSSPFIVACAAIAIVFFCVFVIWELTEEHPIVDLKIFRHRGFTATMFALMLGFGVHFASIVVIPQWLQTSLGYTATQAGYAMAFIGMLALVSAPFVPKLMKHFDPRLLVFIGISWIGMVACLRANWYSTEATFWTISLPQLIQGLGITLFFVPLTSLSLGSVDPDETASAAGIANFGRTLSGAIATAVVTTMWSNQSRSNSADLAGSINGGAEAMASMEARGFSPEQARAMLAQMVEQQGLAQATTHIFAISAVLLGLAACLIWLAPRPARIVNPGMGH